MVTNGIQQSLIPKPQYKQKPQYNAGKEFPEAVVSISYGENGGKFNGVKNYY